LLQEQAGKIDLDFGKRFLADHYDACLEKESPGERSLCAHNELVRQPLGRHVPFYPGGTVDGKVVDEKLARQMAFAARWGSACGRPFDAKAFLAAHPQFQWMQGILRDRAPQPWTVFRARSLTHQQQQVLDSVLTRLRKSSLPVAEQEVRLNAVEAALSGTVAVPDADNPEVRNPSLWTMTDRGYVVAANKTAVEAIADLWIVHEGDDVPVPRIWCYKYSSLIMAKAYIQYFLDTGNHSGLAAINDLIGHNVFPAGLPNQGEGVLWKRRRGDAEPLPGDRVWFENPYFCRGRELIKQSAYEEAIHNGKSAGLAATIAEEAADDAAAGEEGSNVFCLGDNQVTRGAVSVVRASCGGFPASRQKAAPVYEQIYTRKIFTIPRYQQHIIDDFNTVQAYMRANPGSVHPRDFQIKGIRSLIDPDAFVKSAPIANRGREFDRLIDAMASRNKEPELLDLVGEVIPLFPPDYDWSEQSRVRAAMLAVMETKADEMWWRLREHGDDKRYVLTASLNELAENFAVGALCFDLACADLSWAYARHLPAAPGRLPSAFHPEDVFGKKEKEWARVGKPLYEMQIEICQRALEEWASAKGTEPGKDNRFHTYTADEKARFAAAVRKEIEELKRTKRGVFVEALLPGVAAPSGWEGFDAERARETPYSRHPCASRTWTIARRISFHVPGSIITALGNMQPSQQMWRRLRVSWPAASRSQEPAWQTMFSLPAGSPGRQWRPVLSCEPEPWTVASFWATWKSIVQGRRASVNWR
jgi:hypothetical protein